jgi:hypothetical protein
LLGEQEHHSAREALGIGHGEDLMSRWLHGRIQGA